MHHSPNNCHSLRCWSFINIGNPYGAKLLPTDFIRKTMDFKMSYLLIKPCRSSVASLHSPITRSAHRRYELAITCIQQKQSKTRYDKIWQDGLKGSEKKGWLFRAPPAVAWASQHKHRRSCFSRIASSFWHLGPWQSFDFQMKIVVLVRKVGSWKCGIWASVESTKLSRLSKSVWHTARKPSSQTRTCTLRVKSLAQRIHYMVFLAFVSKI